MSDDIGKMYAPPKAEPTAPTIDRSDTLGWILLAMPPIAGALTNLVHPDVESLVGLGLVIGTTILISIDAKKWGVYQASVVGLIFLWIVFYPRYFLRRAKHGAPPRFLLALLSTALYFVLAVGGFLFMTRK